MCGTGTHEDSGKGTEKCVRAHLGIQSRAQVKDTGMASPKTTVRAKSWSWWTNG